MANARSNIVRCHLLNDSMFISIVQADANDLFFGKNVNADIKPQTHAQAGVCWLSIPQPGALVRCFAVQQPKKARTRRVEMCWNVLEAVHPCELIWGSCQD